MVSRFFADELLRRGYFPAELPPPFQSSSLGAASRSILNHLPQILPSTKSGMRIEPTVFHLARQGSLRRLLSIPHPLCYARVCGLIETHSALLDAELQRSPFSSSLPSMNRRLTGRALDRRIKDEGIVQEHARVRAAARYVLLTDITNFYGRFYTHSISWALVGKEIAKAYAFKRLPKTDPHYADAMAADDLDKALRSAQDNQSVGLPIGPDASLLIAETILAKVDRELHLPPGAVATRHVDDYQVGTKSLKDAEAVLTELQSVLKNELELELNPRKTRIVELPDAIEAPWVTMLKGIFRDQMHTSAKQQRRDLLRLFNLATEARAKFPDEHVFAYVVGVLRSVELDEKNWSLAEPILAQMMIAEPGLLPRLVHEFLWYKKYGRKVNEDLLHEVWTDLIVRHAPMGHSSEVAWALWGHVEFDKKLQPDAVEALRRMQDPVVRLLAYHAASLGLMPVLGSQTAASEEDFWSSRWPIAFEATQKGWLAADSDLQKCGGYRTLADHGVSFFDGNARLDPDAVPKPGLLPAY